MLWGRTTTTTTSETRTTQDLTTTLNQSDALRLRASKVVFFFTNALQEAVYTTNERFHRSLGSFAIAPSVELYRKVVKRFQFRDENRKDELFAYDRWKPNQLAAENSYIRLQTFVGHVQRHVGEANLDSRVLACGETARENAQSLQASHYSSVSARQLLLIRDVSQQVTSGTTDLYNRRHELAIQ